MTTVAVGIIVNGAYSTFIPGWLDSVESLTRRPDEVVAVTDVPAKFPRWVRTVTPPDTYSGEWSWVSWADWRNRLAAACAEHDYLSHVDVDDRYRPHALDGCESWSTDVVAMGMGFVDGSDNYVEWLPVVDVAVIGAGTVNQVPNGSPVRTGLPSWSPWDSRFMPFSDWAFWVQAACRGATFSATGRIDFDYRWHEDTAQDPTEVRALLQEWRAAEGYA